MVGTIHGTVLRELKRNARTVQEICQYTGLKPPQVYTAIRNIDLTHHITKHLDGRKVVYKVTRRRAYPKRSGIVRHE